MLRVPLIPLKKNHKTQALFLFLFSLVYVLSLGVVIPALGGLVSFYSEIACHATYGLVLVCFLWASCKNPGVLKPDPQHNFLELLRDVNPADLCPECKLIRSARSRHCAICNCCVERFDHHCPWINNCVGIKNHNAFMGFLFSIWLKIVLHITAYVYCIVMVLTKKLEFGCEDSTCHTYCFFGWCQNKVVVLACSGVCVAICLFYFLLSSLLLYTHIQNYTANRTTNERFSRKKMLDTSSDEQEVSNSVMTLSDFDNDSLIESVVDEDEVQTTSGMVKKSNKSYKKSRRKGCCANCWKMATHTKVVPQSKLYNYLAEQSYVLKDS